MIPAAVTSALAPTTPAAKNFSTALLLSVARK